MRISGLDVLLQGLTEGIDANMLGTQTQKAATERGAAMTADRDQAMERATRELEAGWASDGRWEGIERAYTAADVVRLQGSVQVEHTLARLGAERLWALLHERDVVAALGVLTGGQAVQAVKAGLDAIYLSGWQVAADANLAEQVLDLPPGGGHRGYAAVVDGSRSMVACCCSHSMGDR